MDLFTPDQLRAARKPVDATGLTPISIEERERNRWEAIERTFLSAFEAEQALPGVPLRRIMKLSMFPYGERGKLGPEPLEVAYAVRDNYDQVREDLIRRHPEACLCISPDVCPYAHRRKDLPTYQQWKARQLAANPQPPESRP